MEPEKRCKKGTRKYKPLGEGCHRNEDIENHNKNTLPSGLEPIALPLSVTLPSGVKKRCPKKTRKFKLLGDECYTNEQIDQVNILKASFLSMHKAVDGLSIKPAHLIIDGNRFIPYQKLTHTCIIKGDAKYQSIAAASILAKTHRDELMLKYHEEFPNYAWNENKGYGTLKHRAGIAEFGITPYHRKTFRLLKEQLELF